MTRPALDLRREDFPDLQGPRLDRFLRALNAYGAQTSQALGGSLAGDGWFSRDVTFTARDEWTAITPTAPWTANATTPQIRKIGRRVEIRGTLDRNTAANYSEAFPVATQYEPSAGPVLAIGAGNGTLAQLYWDSGAFHCAWPGADQSNVFLSGQWDAANGTGGVNPCFPVRFKNDLPAKPSHVFVAGGWIIGSGGTETPTVLGPAAWSESRGEIVIHDLGNVLSGTKYRARMLVLR